MRNLNKFVALFLALMMVLAVVPAAVADEATTLRIGLEQDIVTIDPQQNTSAFTTVVTEGITEPLLREHNGEILPGMAESYATEDFKTWTFNIRKNACWNDGTPITAPDIVWAYREIFTRTESTKAVVLFNSVEGYKEVKKVADEGGDAEAVRAAAAEHLGITAEDDYTLKVVLAAPAPYMLETFCHTAWAPIKRDLYEQYGTAYGSDIDKIGTNGPFIVTEWNYNDVLVLEKNPLYWNADAIALDRVEIKVVQDVEPRVNMFKEGKLDYAVASSDYLLTMPEQTEVREGTSWLLVLVNQARRNKDGEFVDAKLSSLLANEHFSAAFNNAINRTVLYESVVGDPSKLPTSYVIPGIIKANNSANQTIADLRNGAYGDIAPLTRNIEVAEAELALALAEVGYASVNDVPEIKIVCSNSTDYTTVAEYMENALDATLGLKVKMDAVEFGVRDERVISGDYDMVLFGWNNKSNDVMDYLSPFASDLFGTGFGVAKPELHAKFSALYEEIISTSDMDSRAPLALEAEELLMRQGPIITLASSGRAHLKSDRFNDFTIRVMGSPFDYTFASPKN